MGYVREFCDRVAVIDSGKLLYEGEPENAIDMYNKLNDDREKQRLVSENAEKKSSIERLGNGKATITDYKILNHKMKESVELESGRDFTAKISFLAKEKLNKCSVGVMFRKDPHENLYGLNNYTQGDLIDEVKEGSRVNVSFDGNMPLNPGTYYVSFSVAGMKGNGYEDFDNLNNVMRVTVLGSEKVWGIIRSDPTINIGVKDG
jgi:hypothetical protein